MEACDFHRRSSPAWGRNCKFPFISSRVALGTSVKWEDFKFGFHPHFRFPIISLHLKGIAGQLYPGPSLGVLTQESDTFEPRDLRLEQAWARRPSGQAWNGSSAPRRSCWRSRDQWFSLSSIASSTSMVSSKVLPIGIEGHGLPFCGQNARPGLPGPRLPSVQQMNEIPCWIFEEKSGLRLLENRIFGFLLEYFVLGSLCVQ